MRKQQVLSMLVLLASTCLLANAQTVNIRLKATVKTADEQIIPGAYIRIYAPDEPIAVDSMFCDAQGMIDKELPFTIETTSSRMTLTGRSGQIVQPIYPNIISRGTGDLYLQYIYPARARLCFMDIQGRLHQNHSVLAGGIYFYFIIFEDGNQSELNKIVLTEPSRMSVELINLMQDHSGLKMANRPWEETDRFYAEIIKDGYITELDTLVIESAVIEAEFHLEEAPEPTASFSYTGNLTTGKPVIFDASGSTGANGEELSYHWDFGDGTLGGTATLPHLFTLGGTYEVMLTVTGDYGAKHSISQNLTVEPASTTNIFTGIVNGYITDENQDNVDDAAVILLEGDVAAYSNAGGIVYLDGLPVGIPIHLKITRNGYVTQVIELTIPEETEESVFFTTLKTRDASMTLYNAEFGGELEGSDGTRLLLPVMPFEKSDGTEVTGNVEVSITPVDVAYEAASFPGTFVGYDETGEDGVLLSYGVSEYHFEQNGEELQLAEGKKATILIPIYTAGAMVGQEIPLWSVNEDNGKWVQEGTGTVVESEKSPTGLALRAEVSHFSWFNCDDFEDDRKKDALCYRWECTSAICVKVKVGCWVSGAQRGSTAGGKGTGTARSSKQSMEERDTIPPVFEVRDFLPEQGKELLMPYSRDVYMEARGFTDDGQLYGGTFTLLTTDDRDTIEIELEPVMAADTVDLPLNTLHEDYLQPGEFLPFRVMIPEKGDYYIVFNRGTEGYFNGTVNVTNDRGIVITGSINQKDISFTAYPGELMISVSGNTQSDEGSFVLGIADPAAWLAGDTSEIEFGIQYEDYIEQATFNHYKIDITEKNLLRLTMGSGSSPTLPGRYRVSIDSIPLISGIINNSPVFFLSEAGELTVSVTGKILTDKGNFRMQLDKVDAIPMSMNDSINDSLTVSNPYRLYSLNSDYNALLKTRFYRTGGTDYYRTVQILSGSGKELYKEYMYDTEDMLLCHLLKDSTYMILISGREDCRYTLITEEVGSVEIGYGDTVRTSLTYFKDKDIYNFAGKEGDLVSVKGYQTNGDLYKGSFVLITPEGEEKGRREIRQERYLTNYDHEIIYKLTGPGPYSILVESIEDDSGSYVLILDTISYTPITLNTLTEIDITEVEDEYLELQLNEDKICHISIISDDAGGWMDIFSGDCERMNERNSYRYIASYYNTAYTNFLKAGRYYVKLTIQEPGLAYFNFIEPVPLALNAQGEISFTDTIRQDRKVKAYYFEGAAGDGVQVTAKRNDVLQVPQKLELKVYPCSTDGKPQYTYEHELYYYTLDSAYLFDAAGKLEGEPEELPQILIAYAETEGIYDLSFHHVTSSAHIVVDDDYNEFPDAQTSSPVAAGFAIREFGDIFIANGEYTSYLAMRVTVDHVSVQGQDKNGVTLRNIYDASNNPVIYLFSEGGSINELSLSCGTKNYYALEFNGASIRLENLVIKPLSGFTKTSGGVKGNGEDLYINGLFLDRTMWGITAGSTGGIIENCTFISDNEAIALNGENIIIRNNDITINSSTVAISANSSYLGTGTQLVENNLINMKSASGLSGNGIIDVERYGGPDNPYDSYIRNNTIITSGLGPAFSAGIGNPPTKIIIEGNRFYCTNTKGGSAVSLQAMRSDGSSDIIVRNNIFEGVISREAMTFYSSDLIAEGHRFAVFNNSFRMAGTADHDVTNHFIRISTMYSNITDTIPVCLANNIFFGDGYSYFAKCQSGFSFYADYNIMYNFSSYITGVGTIIGTEHDIIDDPMFTDTDLHVDPLSPAIDNGATPLQFEFIPETDIDGMTRPQGTGYDIGAYEKE